MKESVKNYLAIAAFVLLAWLIVLVGFRFFKYHYPKSLASANEVPAWMVAGTFGKFSGDEILLLRRTVCSHEPVEITQKDDGTAVLTCGTPVHGPVLVFVADKYVLNSDMANQ